MFPQLGTVDFHFSSYRVFLILAFFAGIFLAVRQGKYRNITTNDILDGALWFMISALAGAHILYMILTPSRFTTLREWFEPTGFVFFGGFIATAVTMLAFAWIRNIGIRDGVDLIAPSLTCGHFFGRIGCFLGGCCYGKPTDSIFGVVFPELHETIRRHPTQLYEATFLLGLTILFSWGIRQRSRWIFPGSIWGAYLLGYGAFRFLIEFIRGDERGGFFLPMHWSISQIIAVPIFVWGILWMVGCYRMRPDRPERHSDVSAFAGPSR